MPVTSARLLRHDRMIVTNELRGAFSSWGDRLIALAVVVIALAALRSSLSEWTFFFAAMAVAGFAAMIGAAAARVIARRLDFHAQDGVVAADALDGASRRHYVLSIHVVAWGVVTLCVLIGRPVTVVPAAAGYLVGAGIAHLAHRLTLGGGASRHSLLRPVRSVLQRPIAGAVAAIPAVLSMLLLGSIGPGPLAGFIASVSAVTALSLTMLDYDVVRFMSASGYKAGRIIGIHARSLLIFAIVTLAAPLALSNRLAAIAIAVAGVVLAALVLLTARILAYRTYSKRAADTFLSLCAGAVALAGVALPLLVPFVVIGLLWHLQRRSVSATWLLA